MWHKLSYIHVSDHHGGVDEWGSQNASCMFVWLFVFFFSNIFFYLVFVNSRPKGGTELEAETTGDKETNYLKNGLNVDKKFMQVHYLKVSIFI